jgi:hypothetical protein
MITKCTVWCDQTFFPVFQESATSHLLTHDHILRLVGALPARFSTKDWRLLYSTYKKRKVNLSLDDFHFAIMRHDWYF